MSTEPKRLLPDLVYHPIMLTLMCALPQLALLGLHLHTFDLIRGELNSEQRGSHLMIMGLLAASTLLWSTLSACLWKRQRVVRPVVALLVFAVGFGYLWVIMHLLQDLIPGTVGAWMVSADELAYNHMALVAPALFYGLVLLAGTPVNLSGKKDTALSALVLVMIPLFWVIVAESAFAIRWDVILPVWILVFFMFVMTALMLLVFLRLLLHLHHWLGELWIMPILASLVFPLAGLALNRAIPFPTDLQDWRIYAFTVVNALVLCWPLGSGPVALWAWLARAVMYPFTLYFFLLFLPFLPLSIPALLVAGSGFLILAPTLLFVVHSRRLVAGAGVLSGVFGWRRLWLFFIIAFSILPSGYIGRAWLHKQALDQVVNAVFHPDYAKAQTGLDINRALAAMERLRDMKEGVYAPLLSEVYDTLVFGGMVLPDHKMKEVERILTGKDAIRPSTNRSFEFFNFIGSSRNRRQNWSNVPPPPRDVSLIATDVHTTPSDSVIESEVILTMQNRGGDLAEFLTAITLPDGVAVSGYWLDVEGTRVEGQIFDRKTALWVFHMIRDRTRRDPGMIHYVNNSTLELRAFPFSASQTRTCAIRFLYPRGLAPHVTIGDQTVMLAEGDGTGIVVAGNDQGHGVLIPPNHDLPGLERERYLHFLVDVSRDAVDSIPLAEEKMAALLEENPNINVFKIDLVNHESRPLSESFLDRSTWREVWRSAIQSTTPSGGFWPERAIHHALYRHHHSSNVLTHTPAIVLVSGQPASTTVITKIPEHTADITINTPDTFDGAPTSTPLVALRCKDQIALIDKVKGGIASWLEQGPTEIYQPGDQTWQAISPDLTLLPEARYSAWMAIQAVENDMASRPHAAEVHRLLLLQVSRAYGILSRQTAFMVVENSAQRKMLERKEKEALNANHALTFDEFQETHVTPEPGVWLMLVLLAPVAAWRWLARGIADDLSPRAQRRDWSKL